MTIKKYKTRLKMVPRSLLTKMILNSLDDIFLKPTDMEKSVKEEKVEEVKIKKKPNKHWRAISFWANNYDLTDNANKKGLHTTHLAKQDPAYFIELLCGYSAQAEIPLNSKGINTFQSSFTESISIKLLFDYWKSIPFLKVNDKSTQNNLNFKAWLTNVVLVEFADKQSPLMEKIKPLKFYILEERKKLKLIINNGVISQADKIFDTNNKYFIFVQDNLGVFYASPTKINDNYDEVHHNAILQNERAKAAGMITVNNGKISSITNFSGHYKPDLRQAREAVEGLSLANAFAHDAHIIYYKPVYNSETDEIEMQHKTFSIDDFLRMTKDFASQIREDKQPSQVTRKI